MPRKTKKEPWDKNAETGKTGKNEMGHGEIKINQIGPWKTRMGHGSQSGPKWNAEYKKWVVENNPAEDRNVWAPPVEWL